MLPYPNIAPTGLLQLLYQPYGQGSVHTVHISDIRRVLLVNNIRDQVEPFAQRSKCFLAVVRCDEAGLLQVVQGEQVLIPVGLQHQLLVHVQHLRLQTGRNLRISKC